MKLCLETENEPQIKAREKADDYSDQLLKMDSLLPQALTEELTKIEAMRQRGFEGSA